MFAGTYVDYVPDIYLLYCTVVFSGKIMTLFRYTYDRIPQFGHTHTVVLLLACRGTSNNASPRRVVFLPVLAPPRRHDSSLKTQISPHSCLELTKENMLVSSVSQTREIRHYLVCDRY